MNEPEESLRERLNGETARTPWRNLLRFFASGSVIAVEDGLDLVEVAMRFANDDKIAVAAWLQAGRIGKVSDEQAAAWVEADAELWTVVVKPWLLVQRHKQRPHAYGPPH
ncbi:MAG TPA: DUF2288 domain-containing protein [Noviherbaspirillum sp.]